MEPRCVCMRRASISCFRPKTTPDCMQFWCPTLMGWTDSGADSNESDCWPLSLWILNKHNHYGWSSRNKSHLIWSQEHLQICTVMFIHTALAKGYSSTQSNLCNSCWMEPEILFQGPSSSCISWLCYPSVCSKSLSVLPLHFKSVRTLVFPFQERLWPSLQPALMS